MTFDQELRWYLEGVDRRPRAPERPRHGNIDPSALREHFLARLRERERTTPHVDVTRLFEEWSPKLVERARYLEAWLQHEAPVDDEKALAFARDVLDRALNHRDATRSLVDWLELARIVDGFDRSRPVETYALENRLARGDLAHRIALTGLGRAFLRLRGHDAVRWLLTIEVAQSRGARDPWRASRELLEHALSSDGITATLDDDDGKHTSRSMSQRSNDLPGSTWRKPTRTMSFDSAR